MSKKTHTSPRGGLLALALASLLSLAACAGESADPQAPDTGSSESGCSTDSDCEADQVCETKSGACLLCAPGTTRCEGTRVMACRGDGSAWDEGSDCDDGDPCTVGDACEAGACATITPKSCDDGDPCTLDACDGTGACRNFPNGQPGCCTKDADCDDGLDCTTDACGADGACTNTGGPCSESVIAFGDKGTGDGQLSDPRAIAVTADGRLVVADTGNDRVVLYNPEGQVLAVLGDNGAGDGQLSQPSGVAVLPDGRIAVADTGNGRIAIFDKAGVWVGAIDGKEGSGSLLESPTGLAAARIGEGIWVASTGSDTVYRLDVSGGKVGPALGGTGSAPGHFRSPRGLVQDAGGTVYVTDNQNGRVQSFDPESGDVTGTFGAPGAEPGQLTFPSDVVITESGFIAVADAGNGRVQLFRACTPDCSGKECGDNGCGGSCGGCIATATCEAGTCTGAKEGGAGCEPQESVLCSGCACEECVCAADPFCCDAAADPGAIWDAVCAQRCTVTCGYACPGQPVVTGEPELEPVVAFSRILGEEELASPVGLAVGPGGVLWVVDNVKAQIRGWRLVP